MELLLRCPNRIAVYCTGSLVSIYLLLVCLQIIDFLQVKNSHYKHTAKVTRWKHIIQAENTEVLLFTQVAVWFINLYSRENSLLLKKVISLFASFQQPFWIKFLPLKTSDQQNIKLVSVNWEACHGRGSPSSIKHTAIILHQQPVVIRNLRVSLWKALSETLSQIHSKSVR